MNNQTLCYINWDTIYNADHQVYISYNNHIIFSIIASKDSGILTSFAPNKDSSASKKAIHMRYSYPEIFFFFFFE